MGDLSAHFSRWEFACHDGCGFNEPNPDLVERLERLRSILGRPIWILSGCRCARHNAAVGGARASQHLTGHAADPRSGFITIQQARKAGFTGIGHRGGRVVHVDVRRGRPVVFRD